MSNNQFRVALVGFVAAGLAGTASANVLLNSGFESGSGADAFDWAEIVGGAAGGVERSGSMPASGSFHAYMTVDHINNTEAAGAYFIEQNQGANVIDNTDLFDLTFDAKVDVMDFTGMDMFVQILWLDQDGSHGGGVKNEMLTSLIGAGINTSYQTFSFLGLDPADGADSFLLRFQLSSGPVPGIQNGLYVDNASLSIVPAPGSVALAMVGLGGMAIRRRR